MATTLHIESFNETNIRERSSLAAESVAGAATITLTSTQGYNVADIIYVGPLSLEGCEKAVVAAVSSATTLTLSQPLTLPHAAYEPVTSVLGDKIHIYRAVNVTDKVPDDTTFTVLVTREIDPDQTSTYYRDSAGSSAYWYRYAYFNETTLEETALSDPIRGDDFAHYASLADIRSEAGFTNAVNLKDPTIDLQRRAAEAEINASLSSAYKVPFSPVPDAVRNLTVQLAAALLLVNAYGSVAPYPQRLKDARQAIAAYSSRSLDIVDVDGNSTSNSNAISSWPTDEAVPRSFRIGDMY